MRRLLQLLRGFPQEQPVKRLELLGFTPRVGYGIGAHRGRGTRTRVADPASQSLDLMKLDVQGAELRRLGGAGGVIRNCTTLIARLSFSDSREGTPLAAEVIGGIESLGFQCTDVCKLRRADPDHVGQIDILFTRAALYHRFRAAGGVR
jgi:hypothetical protein